MQTLTNALYAFPQILTKAHNQSSNISASTSLTCHVVDLGDHHVTWFKLDPHTSLSAPLAVGKQLFTTDSRYSISFYSTSSKDSFWSLDIYRVTLADQGTYTCRIANRKASVSISINLHIVLPMFLTPTDLHVEPGNSIYLNCTILVLDASILMSNPLSLLSWQHSSNSPNQSHFHDIKVRKTFLDNILNSQLTIDRAERGHSGRWTCYFLDQQLSSNIFVEKDFYRHQRVSALVSNQTGRLYSCLYIFFVLFVIVDKY